MPWGLHCLSKMKLMSLLPCSGFFCLIAVLALFSLSSWGLLCGGHLGACHFCSHVRQTHTVKGIVVLFVVFIIQQVTGVLFGMFITQQVTEPLS